MIGNNICEIRKLKGLTLSELAERAKISKSYLSNIERNLNKNPSITVIRKIARVLEVDLRALLTAEPKIESQLMPDKEWLDLIQELKKTGMDKEKLKEFKVLLEFIKWQNQFNSKKSSEE